MVEVLEERFLFYRSRIYFSWLAAGETFLDVDSLRYRTCLRCSMFQISLRSARCETSVDLERFGIFGTDAGFRAASMERGVEPWDWSIVLTSRLRRAI